MSKTIAPFGYQGHSSQLKKFYLLLWKNYLFQKRHLIQTFFELAVPLLVMVILVFMRTMIEQTYYDETVTFKPFPVQVDLRKIPLDHQMKKGPNWRGWTMAWAPDNPVVRRVMQNLDEKSVFIDLDKHGFANESIMVDTVLKAFNNPEKSDKKVDYLCAIVFENEFLDKGQKFPKNIKVFFIKSLINLIINLIF